MTEKTLVLVKPDGVKRGLCGEIISRFERAGLKLVAMKLVWVDENHIDNHYPKDEAWTRRLGEKTFKNYQACARDVKEDFGTDDLFEIGKVVRGWLMKYMTSGPVIAIVLEGFHAIEVVRKLVGHTLPVSAETGSIRGDFSCESATVANLAKRSVYNLIHASETPEEAKNEIDHWFSEQEIHNYKRVEELM